MDAHILVVDDEPEIADLVEVYLKSEGFTVFKCGTGADALQCVNRERLDLAILDVMLPDISGFTLCGEIRKEHHFPVLMLTAKAEDMDKITGLTIGADDYMTKPFSVSELLARVEALCRRVSRSAGGESGAAHSPAALVSGDFVLDENRRVLLKAGKPIELTQVEFQIMELFFHNPGVALVREKILKGVWGENYFGDVKIVDVNIRRLRMKIEDEPSHPTHIMTVWGYGYRWEE